MKLELVLPRGEYLLGEQISVDIRLTNTSGAGVEVPNLTDRAGTQPVYQLRGPAYPEGVTFRFADLRGAGDGEDGGMHQLAPGATMEDGFTLTSKKRIGEPGEYTLSASMEGKGWRAEAAAVRFRVEKATFLDAALGVDVFTESTRTLRGVWLADTGRGRVIGESFFYENRPDISEVRLTGTRIIRGVGAKASEPFCPWVNYDRSEAAKFWHGWREGSVLYAFSDDEDGPRSIDLGSAKARMVRPAVMTRTGDLEVLVLGENRTTLRLIRFPHHAEGKPVVVWSAELPEPVSGIGIGLGPREEGGSMVALAVSQSGLKVSLRMIRVGQMEAEIGPAALIDGAYVLPDAEPGVHIAPDGEVRGAVVVARHPALRTLAVAELVAGKATVTDAGRVDVAVVKAMSAYTVTSGAPVLRFFVRLAVGGVLFEGKELPVAAGGVPVDLVRMSSSSYLLTVDAGNGVKLVAAEF
ncbi:MAG: hypothetical protein JST93_05960 [Acidobacteria bacterium]|nr:hypothetical protein [Acidobacteriota bacterium]